MCRVRIVGLCLATLLIACHRDDGNEPDDGGSPGDDDGSRTCLECEVQNVCCGTGTADWCGEPSCVRALSSHSGLGELALSAEWSPVDDYVLSGGIGELRLFRVDREAGTLTEVSRVTGQPGRVLLAWSSDGQHVLTVSTDVRLFAVSRDPAGLTRIVTHPGHGPGFYTVAWSPDQTHALVAGEDGVVSLFSVDIDGAALVERADFPGDGQKVVMVAWSPDGTHALSVGDDATVRLLAIDVATPEIREVATAPDAEEGWGVSWSRDGRVLTGSGIARNALRSWSIDIQAETLELEQEILGHTSGIGVIAWSPDGRRVMSGGHDDTLRLFDSSESELRLLDVWGEHRLGVHAFSWSPDGTHGVVAGSQCDELLLLDLSSCDL